MSKLPPEENPTPDATISQEAIPAPGEIKNPEALLRAYEATKAKLEDQRQQLAQANEEAASYKSLLEAVQRSLVAGGGAEESGEGRTLAPEGAKALEKLDEFNLTRAVEALKNQQADLIRARYKEEYSKREEELTSQATFLQEEIRQMKEKTTIQKGFSIRGLNDGDPNMFDPLMAALKTAGYKIKVSEGEGQTEIYHNDVLLKYDQEKDKASMGEALPGTSLSLEAFFHRVRTGACGSPYAAFMPPMSQAAGGSPPGAAFRGVEEGKTYMTREQVTEVLKGKTSKDREFSRVYPDMVRAGKLVITE